MEVQELHDFVKDMRDENRIDHKDICAELKRMNGQVNYNKWSIRAIWTVASLAYTAGLLWIKSHW